jgi:hypothetical protein
MLDRARDILLDLVCESPKDCPHEELPNPATAVHPGFLAHRFRQVADCAETIALMADEVVGYADAMLADNVPGSPEWERCAEAICAVNDRLNETAQGPKAVKGMMAALICTDYMNQQGNQLRFRLQREARILELGQEDGWRERAARLSAVWNRIYMLWTAAHARALSRLFRHGALVSAGCDRTFTRDPQGAPWRVPQPEAPDLAPFTTVEAIAA